MLLKRGWIGLLAVCCAGILSACAATPAPPLPRVALLAPFEGQYRAVGYDALYAARLAIQDSGLPIDLVPIDDGGTHDFAVDRARALAGDPLTVTALLIGCNAASADVQHALGDIPALVIGESGVQTDPVRDGVFKLAAQDETVSCIGSARDFPLEAETTPAQSILSSAILPDAEYSARIRTSDPFAPAPMLLSTLIYDATKLAAQVIVSGDRSQTADRLAQTGYTGLNGTIRFVDGWWDSAPLYEYTYDESGQLIQAGSG